MTKDSPSSDSIISYKEIEEEKLDDATGKVIRIVRKIALKKIHATVTQKVSERLNWKKFGNAKSSPPGPDISTTTIGEEVFLKLSRNTNFDVEKTENKSDRRLTCRSCGGEHWTSKCPFKDTLPAELTEEEANIKLAEAASLTSTKYIPPSLRYGKNSLQLGQSSMCGERDESSTVRVTNLSEYTRENDLYDLFSRAGRTTRIFVAKDHETGMCKGYGFVSYEMKDEAQKAIDLLNGHGFGNLIMRVEWAKERNL